MSERFGACYFDSREAASNTILNGLRSRWSWLSEEYLDFLRVTNGCVLEFFVFYGAGINDSVTVETCQHVAEPYGNDRWFVAGHDASGDALVLGQSGDVGLIGTDPPPDEPTRLCSGFHELIEHVCCGPGYADYFGGDVDESEWFEFIRARGWTE